MAARYRPLVFAGQASLRKADLAAKGFGTGARCRPRTQAEKLHGRRHRAARRYFAPLSIASCPRRDCAKRYFQPLEFALFFDAVCPRGASHRHRRAGHEPQSLSGLLLLHKSTLDHVVARLGGVALFEAALFKHGLEGLEHFRAAAKHHAVFGGVEFEQAQVARQYYFSNWSKRCRKKFSYSSIVIC